jgi:hypothetical protein
MPHDPKPGQWPSFVFIEASKLIGNDDRSDNRVTFAVSVNREEPHSIIFKRETIKNCRIMGSKQDLSR